MKFLTAIAAVTVLAVPASAQTKSNEGDGYTPYVHGALSCMAAAPGDATAQDACIVEAVEECRSKAGVFASCLEALRDGFDAAQTRVEAEELKVCDGKLDSACAVVLRGHALIRSGQGLNAAQWAKALTEGE